MEEDIDDTPKGTKEQQSQQQALDRVTDVHEDKELDTARAEQNLKNLFDDEKKKSQLKAQRERELAAVVVKDEDIELIVKEMELSRQAAELTLREHKGDVVAALQHLVTC